MGWRLVNNDLGNSVTTRVRTTSPVVVIYNGNDRTLAPITEINTSKANGFDVFELPDPVFTGYLQYVNLGLNVQSITWQNHNQVENGEPLRVVPNRYWNLNGEIYSYELNKSLTSVSINLVLQIYAGATVNETVSLRVENFVIDLIEVSGFVFTQGTQAGQFEQSGSTITIHTSNQYRINAGDSIYLIGTGTYDFTYQNIAIASFIVPSASNIREASWLGINFVPSGNIYRPQLFDFFWSEERKLLTLFIPEASLPPVIIPEQNYLSFLSSIQYDRPSL
jgi:hypothetical protein